MFKIITDSGTDLPVGYYEENHVACMNLSYIVDGETYGQGKELPWKEFYEMMRQGKMPTTSQINPEDARIHFEKALETDKEILCLVFSSGLSGTYNNICIAAGELMEEHPDCKIVVIDTLCASMGQGLMVHKAVELRDAGKTIDETAAWVNAQVPNLVHMVTVDDLFHLHRGGRVSKASAVAGTLIGIKPVIHVDDEGHLIVIDKVRGRKKSLMKLVDAMEEKTKGYPEENDIIFITHGDDFEAAEFVKDMIKERFGFTNFLINNIGPVIGSHAGPGTIALFFFGKER